MNVASNEAVIDGVRRFREKSGRSHIIDDAAVSHGQSARTLAAAKPGGLLLCVDVPELSFWLCDGMDITSKLICLASDDDACTLLSRCHDDIRLTVHCQHAIAFLGDVRDHRFDLMVFSAMDAGLAELAVSSLAPGGMLAVFPPGDGENILASHGGLFTGMGADGAVIAVKTPDDRQRKRRGGRKRRPLSDL